MSKEIYSISQKTKNTLTIRNAMTNQIVRNVNVDGDIISTNVTGDVGLVNVKKGNIMKTYVYDLTNGSVKKIYTV